MGQLVTVSQQIASADTSVDIRGGAAGACNQGAEFAFIVEIQAGTELMDIEASDIDYNTETQVYTIHLPPPKLTSCNVYDDYSRYAYRQPQVSDIICQSHEKDFAILGEYQVVQAMRDQALADGILEEAERENEQTLVSFLSVITGKTVEIAYKDIDPEHALSCYPDAPPGWQRVEDNGGKLYWDES
jgi:hypothetical protein